MRRIASLALLSCSPFLASAQESPPGPTIRSPEFWQATPFVEVAGERELSGQLIARPRQLDELRSLGLSTRQALTVQAAARRELQHFRHVRYVAATDETLLPVPSGWSEERLAARLMATGLFEYVEPDWIVFPISAPSQGVGAAPTRGQGPGHQGHQLPSLCPDDPMLSSQWQHDADILGSCKAWLLGTGTPGIGIGVCDTGLRVTHEDLLLNRLEGYNAVDQLWESEGGDIGPAHHHGTRTTGTLAANGDNGFGIAGVGWNLSHRMLRVSNKSDGGAQLSVLQHAARTSIESGDRIANVSYHGAQLSTNPATATYIKALGGLMVWGGRQHLEQPLALGP